MSNNAVITALCARNDGCLSFRRCLLGLGAPLLPEFPAALSTCADCIRSREPASVACCCAAPQSRVAAGGRSSVTLHAADCAAASRSVPGVGSADGAGRPVRLGGGGGCGAVCPAAAGAARQTPKSQSSNYNLPPAFLLVVPALGKKARRHKKRAPAAAV